MRRRALLGYMAMGVAAGTTGWRPALAAGLVPSGPISVRRDGTVIENMDIAADHTAITVEGCRNVIIRNCRIVHNLAGDRRDAVGIYGVDCAGLTIEGCEVINGRLPERGPLDTPNKSNILVVRTEDVVLSRVTVRGGSTGAYLLNCTDCRVDHFESHDIRGPFPRGMALQLAGCHGTHVAMDLSDESIPGTSNNEDSFSVYSTPNVTMARVKVPMTSDAVSGRGLVVEQDKSTGCRIEDAEFGWVFNGVIWLGGDKLAAETRVRGWNRYSVRGLPGSTNGGQYPPSMLAVGGEVRDLDVSHLYWDATPSNLVSNGKGLNGIRLAAVDWRPRLSVVRNHFPWRSTNRAPEMLLPVRIGSYWQPNPNTGEPGVYGNRIKSGSVLSVLPGKYEGDPTARAWQWYRDGMAIAGATGMNYVVRKSDLGSVFQVSETPANRAGSGPTSVSAEIQA